MRRGGIALIAIAVVAACDDRPSDAQLDRWRAEAQAANAAAVETARTSATEATPWSLGIYGETTGPAPTTVAWAELDQLASFHLHTKSPQNPADPDAIIDFRGVRVRDLLRRFPPAGAATEVTFLAYDAYRSTVQIADIERFDITLAIEADGQPIPRGSGGPIFLVFPHTSQPETQSLYPDRYWGFYITDMIIGTEPAVVDVAGTRMDRVALGKLPTTRFDRRVQFKVHWPSEPVRLRGVTLANLLAAAGITLRDDQYVTVRGKARVQRDPDDPVRFSAADIAACDILLTLEWGLAYEPISAKLGGPAAIAIPPDCDDRYGAKAWVTFVESIEVGP